jgi:hypothetical protein
MRSDDSDYRLGYMTLVTGCGVNSSYDDLGYLGREIDSDERVGVTEEGLPLVLQRDNF